MARHHPSDTRVQAVTQKLVAGFMVYRSVNSLADALSQALDAEAPVGRIYPNRVHGLLSDDPDRSINTATLEALESACERLDLNVEAAQVDDLVEVVAREIAGKPEGLSDPIADAATALNLPPAVVRALLPVNASKSQRPVDDIARTRIKRTTPDWSWQEEALDSVLTSIRKTAARRVGLVIPTGGGKTRLGLRAALERISQDPRPTSVALWVTHRKTLKRQARRELQRLISEHEPVPERAADLFGRIQFTMVRNLDSALAEHAGNLSLVVVDEAHHAAAPSYKSLFDRPYAPALFLTATPNRADALPIGIDEVAYTISYRELFERQCVIEPKFHPSKDMPGLDWATTEGLRDLADYLLEKSEFEFAKVLVVVTQQERAVTLYNALVEALDGYDGHPLTSDDLGFVHGRENSGGLSDAGDFLDEFSAHERGILVATAQLVGEGFDDPGIDSVVITYPSSSIGHLMQVAGRALRWAPGKACAHVVQVRESSLEYHFEQRWLYQDISDALRPELLDFEYASENELRSQVQQVLDEHRVDDAEHSRVLAELDEHTVGDDLYLLLSGVHYYGPAERFSSESIWNPILVTPDERERFLGIFNSISSRDEDVREHDAFLANYLTPDPTRGSAWKAYVDLIESMEYARRELHDVSYAGSANRNHRPGLSSTWLRYATFKFKPAISAELEAFLEDAVNRKAVLSAYEADRSHWGMVVRLVLPLTGSVAYLLTPVQGEWLLAQRKALISRLQGEPLGNGFDLVDAWSGSLTEAPVPVRLLREFGQLLRREDFAARIFALNT